ncbi:ribonuclease HII [Atopococcus tabaci]|uniref:ribonuclease HII n=1 Tax=Atopococcus tabaci TaxID=269774 RepID=UPI0024094E4B|nr:ribonuclease HII [Atopococcus tabaci]
MTQPNKKKSISEIKELLKTITDEKDERLALIAQDERLGVQKALMSWKKARQKIKEAEEERDRMLVYEKALWEREFHYVAGIDEVGRGPLAGPVVTASVVLPPDVSLVGIRDSKKLSVSKREKFYEEIMDAAVSVGIGVVDAAQIDELNILQATKAAMKKSIEQLTVQPDYLLVDALELPLPIPQTSIIKGDATSLSIAAASIIAKVTRDRMMTEYDELYPGYGFSKNAGYGTQEHLNGLKNQGPSPIHRYSFSPVTQYKK